MDSQVEKEEFDDTRRGARKVWEEPAIVMERSLVAEAQGEDPLFLGPLSASGIT